MSMDNFVECSTCKAHMAARLWVRLYGSLEAADFVGGGMDFLSALLPSPAVIKVEVCFSCKKFAPSLDYTPDEKEAMKKRNEEALKKNESMTKINDSLGKIFGK